MDEMNKNVSQGGPNFEPGPGWGAHIAHWLGKYFWPVVVLAIALLGLYLGSRL